MHVEEIQELRYTKAIETYLKKDPHNKYVEQLFETFDNLEIKYYIWGGAVRNPLIPGPYISTSDIDILVDDPEEDIDIEKLLTDLGGHVKHTSLNSPRWIPEDGLQIDVSFLSNATMLKHKKSIIPSINTSLMSCDFTASAIAYDPTEKIVHSYGAIEAIDKQEFELLYTKEIPLATLFSNLILKSDKTKFNIGPKAKILIIKEYNPDLDPEITNYMIHKGAENEHGHVIQRLRDIQNQSKYNQDSF